jgi:hypothetical protein
VTSCAHTCSTRGDAVGCTRRHRRSCSLDGEPAEVLAEQTRELGLLVMGSRGYGPLRRVLLGSVSDAILDRADCPVMIVPRGVQRSYGSAILHARPSRSH